ncbi:hypothetical protein [Cereibacter changlensis]|uniref:hypothetical protein n=1 Tax=Cereibacter changlensis TaxID=402884 RepID=UPI0040341D0D
MSLKEILVSIVAPLVVMVLGTAAIYHYTEYWKSGKNFTLSVVDMKSIRYQDDTITIVSVVISNTTQSLMSNSVLTLEGVPVGAEVSVKFDRNTNDPESVIAIGDSQVSIHVGNVRSNQELAVDVFLRSPVEPVVVAGLYSDEAIATLNETSPASDFSSRWRGSPEAYVVIGAAIALIVGSISRVIFALMDKGYYPTRNNAGFVLMHAGLLKEGSAILSEAVTNGEVGEYELRLRTR